MKNGVFFRPLDRHLTVKDIVQRVGKRLQLCSLTGACGQDNLVLGDFPNAAQQALVGPLNCIHPNRIQVIGKAELLYLEGLSVNAHQKTLEKLFQDRPAVILFADNCHVEEAFLEQAKHTNTPVLISPLDDTELVASLHYLLAQALAKRTTIHGVLIEVLGMGVLLTGESGVGKSELTLALIGLGHRLVADDAPEFMQVAPDVINGSCPVLLRDFLEIRGLGILNVRAMFGDSAVRYKKDLHLIIHLQRMNDEELASMDRLLGTETVFAIQGVEVPRITLPVTPGRNLAVLVEAAVRNHSLRLRGYDATSDFVERQAQLIENSNSTSNSVLS
jgi:HPr kinase/phosphorylase